MALTPNVCRIGSTVGSNGVFSSGQQRRGLGQESLVCTDDAAEVAAIALRRETMGIRRNCILKDTLSVNKNAVKAYGIKRYLSGVSCGV